MTCNVPHNKAILILRCRNKRL